mmetsp:Transcript_11009/g.41005  ORF Transcript_11009/g.41005 Transcript_11009/m.41005 type:complete len:210 (-) Transcript_11009:3122-3751(-)
MLSQFPLQRGEWPQSLFLERFLPGLDHDETAKNRRAASAFLKVDRVPTRVESHAQYVQPQSHPKGREGNRLQVHSLPPDIIRTPHQGMMLIIPQRLHNSCDCHHVLHLLEALTTLHLRNATITDNLPFRCHQIAQSLLLLQPKRRWSNFLSSSISVRLMLIASMLRTPKSSINLPSIHFARIIDQRFRNCHWRHYFTSTQTSQKRLMIA